MKTTKYVIFIASMILMEQTFGQTKKIKAQDEVLFNIAMEYYDNEVPDSAIYFFEKMIITHPQSELKARAHYNIGRIYFEKKDYQKSKSTFLEIINQNYNEYDKAGGLMEQYTLYKHNSCEHLTEIFLLENNHKEAMKYIRLFDKKYPYKHFCGNELYAYKIYKARCFARVFEAKNLNQKALKKLLPFISNNGLASNDLLLTDLKRVINKVYTKNKIETELQLAFNSISKIKNFSKDYIYIKLFNQKVKLYDASLYDLRNNEEIGQNLMLEGYPKFKKVFLTNGFIHEYFK